MIVRDFLICLLQMYLLEDLEKNMLPYRRENFWGKFLIYFVVALIMLGINHLESSIFNMVMIPVTYMIVSMVVFRGNIWKKLVIVCCYYVLAIIPEFLFATLTNAYGVTGASEGFGTEIEKTLALLLMSTMTFLFIKCINQVTRKRNYLTIENKTFTVLLMLPTATIIILGCVFYSNISFEGMNRVMVPVGASLLLLTNIFIFSVFDRFVEKSEEVKKMDRLYQKSRAEIANLQYMNKVNEDNRASENVRTDDFRIIEKTAKDTVYIFFHTALGTTNCYRFVEKELRKEDLGDFLFINVEDVEWYYSIQYHELVDRITDEYVRKIEQLHYKNINLIGYCLGGILALNVAVKLLEKGIEVNNLFVIDSYPVSGKVEDEFIDEVIFLPNYQLMLSEVLEDVDDFKVMEFITEVRKRNNGNIPQNTFFNIIEKDSKMKNNSGLWEFVNSTKEKRFEAYAKAIEKKTCINVSAELLEATFEIYQHGFKGANVELPFYSGDICYLSACEEQKYFFADKNQNLEMWNDICLGEFEVINVPGNHVTCIHSEENATLLAQIIIERNIRG